jgi:small-conductance mechanosensitive channel/CRP-like cAMP-binding protein
VRSAEKPATDVVKNRQGVAAMEWWDELRTIMAGSQAWGIALGCAVAIVLGILWRSVLNGILRRVGEGPAKVFRATSLPGYLIVCAIGFQTMILFSPIAMTHPRVAMAADTFLYFVGILIFGEALFALGIDYYLRVRHRTEVPSIIEQLLKGILYLIVALSVLSTTYRVDITPLLTTSAVFTMVLGLALQDVLGNFFSGLSVHISPPFRIGDWIEVAGFFGQVVESNWRATVLRKSDHTLVVLPNNDIAKKEIRNVTQRHGTIFREFEVGLAYQDSPERVRRALLGACRQVAEILPRPAPRVFMQQFQDFSISYRIRYWIKAKESHMGVQDKLASRIWYRLKRDGLTIPFPIREVFMHPEKDLSAQTTDRRLALLSQVDFLRDLDRTHRAYLCNNLDEHWYETGECVVAKGACGTEFYIVDHGSVAVHLDDGSGPAVATLRRGEFFGEMSLLTGEPRSATVKAAEETRLLVLGKETISQLLHENRELADVLSRAIAERQTRNLDAEAARESKDRDGKMAAEGRGESPSNSVLLHRIKRFFRLI